MRRHISSGGCPAHPNTPSPPALETAATSSGGVGVLPLVDPMPARKIGYSMPRSAQIGVLSKDINVSLKRRARCALANDGCPRRKQRHHLRRQHFDCVQEILN